MTNASNLTRRGFLGASAATFAAIGFPSAVVAQEPKYRRHEISSSNLPSNVLDSYKKAIRAMLALPPTDPCNWYRNALVHTLDCPHGNWWFLVWHRAYIGWFERTCRKLSGDPDFALPYWDWTKTPRIPAAMFEDVLDPNFVDPNNKTYIPTFDGFKERFNDPIKNLWASFNASQRDHLARRNLNSVEDFWFVMWHPDQPRIPHCFFQQPSARGLKAADPDLPRDTKDAVSTTRVGQALREEFFANDPNDPRGAGFGSAKAPNHQTGNDVEGTLESFPHNSVHDGLGDKKTGDGFMTFFLSPVDPIFFLHHANIDRLWDVWTRRQANKNPPQPSLPEGSELATWSSEQFLFFSDENRQPVSTNAGDYATMTTFNYDYEPGEGEKWATPTVVAQRAPSHSFAAQISSQKIRAGAPGGGVAEIPGDLLQPLGPEAPPRVAEVTLNLRPEDQGRRFQVLVSVPGGKPIDAGTIRPFGAHLGPHAAMRPTTFTVPLPEDLGAPLGKTVPLDVRIVPLDEARGAAGELPLAPAPGKGEQGFAPPKHEKAEIAAAAQVAAIRVRTQ
jgi:hypothetical protein